MYRYQFTSTVPDLLDAEECDRTARSVRVPFRWALIVLALVWIVSGFIAFDLSNPTWKPLLWLLLGFVLLYYFVVAPYLRRRRIKRSNSPKQDIILEFNSSCISIEITGVDSFKRRWEELMDFVDTEKGVLFYFSDGVVNWLPKRVFSGSAERAAFIQFLGERMKKGPG